MLRIPDILRAIFTRGLVPLLCCQVSFCGIITVITNLAKDNMLLRPFEMLFSPCALFVTKWAQAAYLQGAHSLMKEHTITYWAEHCPPMLCLAHSGVVMCLSQRVSPALGLCLIQLHFYGHLLYQYHLLTLYNHMGVCVIWVTASKCGLNMKCRISGSVACPFMVHMLNLSPAKCSFCNEVISFPSCGRLGAQDIH